jgi:cell division transport system ATP-binding protein
MDIFRAINAGGTTVLMATHDENLITYLNRRVVHLRHGQVVGDHGSGAPTGSEVQA